MSLRQFETLVRRACFATLGAAVFVAGCSAASGPSITASRAKVEREMNTYMFERLDQTGKGFDAWMLTIPDVHRYFEHSEWQIEWMEPHGDDVT
jgi:hypothetical protein